jgi:mannose-6-phosphate isomerase-like protein (cupin superfamily)
VGLGLDRAGRAAGVTALLIGRLEDAERLNATGVLRAALEDLTLFEYVLEPGGTPGGPHVHKVHTDTFYVLEGELEFKIDGRAIRAIAGTHLVAPRGAVHAFPVAVGGPARFLNIHAPGMNFDRYIRELTAKRARGEEPDAAFFEQYDQFNV